MKLLLHISIMKGCCILGLFKSKYSIIVKPSQSLVFVIFKGQFNIILHYSTTVVAHNLQQKSLIVFISHVYYNTKMRHHVHLTIWMEIAMWGERRDTGVWKVLISFISDAYHKEQKIWEDVPVGQWIFLFGNCLVQKWTKNVLP